MDKILTDAETKDSTAGYENIQGSASSKYCPKELFSYEEMNKTLFDSDIKKITIVHEDIPDLNTLQSLDKIITPSVVISDFSQMQLDNGNKSISPSEPQFLNTGTNEFDEGYICERKASDCSTCSSISTVDMNFNISPLQQYSYDPSLILPSASRKNSLSTSPLLVPIQNMNEKLLRRRCSNCSVSSCFSSEEETEPADVLSRPNVSKDSQWRKVKHVVQWSPFVQTYKKHKYPWIQLAGHQGNFQAGHEPGTILKKLCHSEKQALEALMEDPMKPLVPQYLGVVKTEDGEEFLQLEDLLNDFTSPFVMDVKMGVRTYLEEDLSKARHNPKLRKDMYSKMVQVDPLAPTEAEHQAKAITKPRYMVWRETISSTSTLGFRIEGVRMNDGTSSKEFKNTRTRAQVLRAFEDFVCGRPRVVVEYIEKLKEIRKKLSVSPFFKSHEFIGSSLLFVHNDLNKTGLWLIDFAKTIPLPSGVDISHNVPWVEGTHEDGYLIGLDNLIDLLGVLQGSVLNKSKKPLQLQLKANDDNFGNSTEKHSRGDFQQLEPRAFENHLSYPEKWLSREQPHLPEPLRIFLFDQSSDKQQKAQKAYQQSESQQKISPEFTASLSNVKNDEPSIENSFTCNRVESSS